MESGVEEEYIRGGIREDVTGGNQEQSQCKYQERKLNRETWIRPIKEASLLCVTIETE